jgi:hypothetical protein
MTPPELVIRGPLIHEERLPSLMTPELRETYRQLLTLTNRAGST